MSSILLIFIYLAFISLGLPDSLFGSTWPQIHESLNVDISYQGIITMIISFGTIVSSLFSDKLLRKMKPYTIIVLSTFLTALALFGFSISTKFYHLIIFSIPYGLGAGAIDSTLNNYVALNYTSKHLNFLHGFWGIGTIIGPNIMSLVLLNSTNWNKGYLIVSLIQFSISIILFLSIPIWKKTQTINEENGKEEVIPNKLTLIEKLKIKNVIYVLLGFFGYCAMEATMFNWTSSYLFFKYNLTESIAARLGSLFFIGLTSSRILSGFISNKFSDKTYLRIGMITLLIGLIIFSLPFNIPYITYIGVIISGFGAGPIYPMIIHLTPLNFTKENSQAIIGLEMASAYFGSTFMPPLFGIIASKISIKLLPFYLFIFFIIMFIMIELLNKQTKLEKNL